MLSSTLEKNMRRETVKTQITYVKQILRGIDKCWRVGQKQKVKEKRKENYESVRGIGSFDDKVP
jgi:hypothetical protein